MKKVMKQNSNAPGLESINFRLAAAGLNLKARSGLESGVLVFFVDIEGPADFSATTLQLAPAGELSMAIGELNWKFCNEKHLLIIIMEKSFNWQDHKIDGSDL
jgi:hypothetical protein